MIRSRTEINLCSSCKVSATFEDGEMKRNRTHNYDQLSRVGDFLGACSEVSEILCDQDEGQVIGCESDGSACCLEAHGKVARNKI